MLTHRWISLRNSETPKASCGIQNLGTCTFGILTKQNQWLWTLQDPKCSSCVWEETTRQFTQDLTRIYLFHQLVSGVNSKYLGPVVICVQITKKEQWQTCRFLNPSAGAGHVLHTALRRPPTIPARCFPQPAALPRSSRHHEADETIAFLKKSMPMAQYPLPLDEF